MQYNMCKILFNTFLIDYKKVKSGKIDLIIKRNKKAKCVKIKKNKAIVNEKAPQKKGITFRHTGKYFNFK